jgi:hypothetical protein
MNSPLPIVPAELLQLELLGRGLLVLRGGVVAPFALGALERDDLARCCHGVAASVMSLVPLIGGALDQI